MEKTFMEHAAYNRRLFRRYAPIYDYVTKPLLRMHKMVAELSNADKNMHILDVACGTGEQALAFARLGCKVTGIDLCPEMLKKALQKCRHKSPITFLEASATELPFPNQTFDVTCMSFALHDMPHSMRIVALNEMHRVTKKGGKIIITDYSSANKVWIRCVHFLCRIYESKYYKEFLTMGLVKYMGKATLPISFRKLCIFGLAETVVSNL